MKCFRDFLEECIGKKIYIDFRHGSGNEVEIGKILEVHADFVMWQSIDKVFLYVPLDNIATVGMVTTDTQNSEN